MERASAVARGDDTRRRELVRRAAMLLSANLPPREVFAQFGQVVAETIGADALSISTLTGDGLSIEFLRGDASSFGDSAVRVPVVFGGQVLGVLSVATLEKPLSEEDRQAIQTCAVYLGALIQDERRTGVTLAAAAVDGLTGLSGREAFDEALEKELKRCQRANAPLSIVVLDVDHFRAFNEAYGHVAGDTVLRQIARAAAQCAGRPGDVFARFCGEQFAAILPFTDVSGAVIVAERMREAVFSLAIPHERSTLGRVTVSGGVSGGQPDRKTSSEQLLERALQWVLRCKELGRNRVCAPAYESSARGAMKRSSGANNVPQMRTSFIGRAEDVIRVTELMQTERAVTLLGPGGTGKTRLAIEAAREMVSAFNDGVWFIDLTAVTHMEVLLAAVAAAAKLGSVNTPDPAHFARRIMDRRMLIVLDNCEQLLPECREFVNAIMRDAPEVKILSTSREPLAVSGERVYRLPTLDEKHALQLFFDRAAQTGVALKPQTHAIVERIVRKLDGLPLAIELAAARLSVMSAEDLERSLETSLSALRSTSDALPARQQTLEALIDWSYAMLSDPERRLFRRLGAFPSSWTADAVEPVTGEPPHLLEELLSKSLVHRADDAGPARFRFLQVTHMYARRFLRVSGDEDAVLAALCEHYAGIAAERAQLLEHLPMTAWLSTQMFDRDNYIAAIRFAVEHHSHYLQAETLLESLRHWFHERGTVDFLELLPLFQQAMSQPDIPDSLSAAIALAAADLYGTRDLRRARDAAEKAMRFYREVGDGVGAAHALERLATAQRYLEATVDPDLETPMRNGIFAAKRIGDKRLAALLLRTLADCYAGIVDAAKEREALLEAHELLRQSGDDDRSGIVLGRLAVCAFWSGDYEEARNTIRAAITLLEHSGQPWNVGFQMMNLGLFELFRGDFTAARVALQKSVQLLELYAHEYAIANTFLLYALLAERTGRLEAAARCVAYADMLFSSGARQQKRMQQLQDQLLERLRSALDQEEFDRCTRAGRAMTRAQALAETAQI